MQFYEYKGFIIYPAPRLQFESDTWKIYLTIRRGKRIKSFDALNAFGTKGEATFQCIHYGKRIIDGEIEELTIDDIL
jgi:hypothetical protein